MARTLASRALASIREAVFAVPSTPDLFNPYRDANDDLDRKGAPLQRRNNLRCYLEAVLPTAEVLVVAEAPGPRGCRFSGVPITSEALLAETDFPIVGVQTSIKGPYREYSATIFWRVMLPYWDRFVVWNAVPLHPHKPGKPMSIRTPRRSEVAAFAPHLAQLVALLEPMRTVAVGRVAERVLTEIGQPCEYIRHPSQGGATLFADGMTSLWASVR